MLLSDFYSYYASYVVIVEGFEKTSELFLL